MGLSARWAMLLGSLAVLATAQEATAQTPSITVGGLGYLQYAYQMETDSSLKPSGGHQNNFDVTRAYINVLGKLPHGVSARITTDIAGRNGTFTQLYLRLKYAFVAWTPENSPLTYKIGEIHTPWLDWEEALWDYRMQGQMAMERAGYLSSSDFGAGIDGNFGYDKLNFQVGLYNGENYSGTPGDFRKDVMGRASFKILNTDLPGKVGGLRVSAYGQYGKPNTGGERYRAIGQLSYKSKMITLAGEFGWTKDSVSGDSVGAANVSAEKKGQVLSFYGVLNIPNTKAAIIARWDQTDPNTANNSAGSTNDKISRVIAGVSYQLTPNLRLLADADVASREGGNYNNAFNATRSTFYFQTQVSF
ncbi:MAG TPA: porin [Gemmatimonadales bacterium]|nr:porin [Gemmatimonadales bacterium]